MTYTVKNGTWCKDNTGEYFSCTKVGLIAAQAAGEIPGGTRVVIHERLYTPGQLVDSFNPTPPEGCFVPDGSAFDTSIYAELAEVFPSGTLPDLRECTLVMVGRSGRPEITNHDEYTVGQFKNDQFAEHAHGVTDPGHVHTVTDPGHDHGRGTQNITGVVGDILQGSTSSGAFYNERGSQEDKNDGEPGETVHFDASRTWSGRSENVATGVTVDSGTTGITVDAACAADNVTHGKQVGVYRYIAF